jgi:hypothetical protein
MTTSGAYVYKEAILSVSDGCDSVFQVITLASNTTEVFTVLKNEGVVTAISADDIEALFVLAEPNRCLLESFDVVHSGNDTLVAEGDELYAVLDLANRDNFSLSIDSDIEAQDGSVTTIDYEFKILATSNGEVTAEKDVVVQIVVCGWEVISADSDSALELSTFINVVATAQDTASLFSSNDTDCPVTNYTLQSADNCTEACAPTDDDLLNFDLSADDSQIDLTPDTQGNYTFYVLAESVTGASDFKEIALSVDCNGQSQTVGLADISGVLDPKEKNAALPVTLLSAADIASFFTLTDTERCGIQTFKVLDENGNEPADDSVLGVVLTLASRTSAKIKMVTTVTLADDEVGFVESLSYNFSVEAEADGGSTATKDFTATITVCGGSEVLTASVAEFTVDQFIADANQTDPLLVQFDTTDDQCPPIIFTLSNESDSIVTPESPIPENIEILSYEPGEVPEIKFMPETVDVHTIYVHAETISGVSISKQLNYTVECGPDSTNVSLVTDEAHIFDLIKNQGVVADAISTELNEGFFASSDARCPVISLAVVSPDGSEICEDSNSTLWEAMDLENAEPLTYYNVTFDTDIEDQNGTVVMLDYYFAINATADGGASAVKQVEFAIVVCGYEVISAADEDVNNTLAINVDNSTTGETLADLFTTNDTDCPANSFSLKMDTSTPDIAADPTEAELGNFNFTTDGDNLLYTAEDEGQYTFYVLGESVTQKYAY